MTDIPIFYSMMVKLVIDNHNLRDLGLWHGEYKDIRDFFLDLAQYKWFDLPVDKELFYRHIF